MNYYSSFFLNWFVILLADRNKATELNGSQDWSSGAVSRAQVPAHTPPAAMLAVARIIGWTDQDLAVDVDRLCLSQEVRGLNCKTKWRWRWTDDGILGAVQLASWRWNDRQQLQSSPCLKKLESQNISICCDDQSFFFSNFTAVVGGYWSYLLRTR